MPISKVTHLNFKRRDLLKYLPASTLVSGSAPQMVAGFIGGLSIAGIGKSHANQLPSPTAAAEQSGIGALITAAGPYAPIVGATFSAASFFFGRAEARKNQRLLNQISQKLDVVIEHLEQLKSQLTNLENKVDALTVRVDALGSEIAEDRREDFLRRSYVRIGAYRDAFKLVFERPDLGEVNALIAEIIDFETDAFRVPKLIEACEVGLLLSRGKLAPILHQYLMGKISVIDERLYNLSTTNSELIRNIDGTIAGRYVTSVSEDVSELVGDPPSALEALINWESPRTISQPNIRRVCTGSVRTCDLLCKTETTYTQVPNHEFNNGLDAAKSRVNNWFIELDDNVINLMTWTLMRQGLAQYVSSLDLLEKDLVDKNLLVIDTNNHMSIEEAFISGNGVDAADVPAIRGRDC